MKFQEGRHTPGDLGEDVGEMVLPPGGCQVAGYGRGSCILFPVQWDNDLLLAHESELAAGDLLDVRRIGAKVLHLLPEPLVLLAKSGVFGAELLLLPVQVAGADDAHLSEEGKQEGQQGNSSDGQERPALLQPRFCLVKQSGVTQTESLWKVRRWTGV